MWKQSKFVNNAIEYGVKIGWLAKTNDYTPDINFLYNSLTGTVNIRKEKNVVCLDLSKINGTVSHDVLVIRFEKLITIRWCKTGWKSNWLSKAHCQTGGCIDLSLHSSLLAVSQW